MSSPGVTFLCLRRGVSFLSSISHPRDCFSLPTQRCFWRQGVIYGQWRLFSAYAEVFPHSPFGFLPSSSFLCLRRGVSRWKCLSWVVGCFSLPTQRCFRLRRRLLKAIWLFSAYAEVFPNPRPVNACRCAFLCLRRGVSASTVTIRAARPFSLPTQRCFYLKRHHPEKARLFSAYAEVFPGEGTIELTFTGFSLPTQRCFLSEPLPCFPDALFSAYAEVFPVPAECT